MNTSQDFGRPKFTVTDSAHPEQSCVIACLTVLAVALLLPEAAMAATAPWDKTLKAIIDYVNSGTARLIAVLVVMGVGFMALFGRISMQVVGSIVIGIILVFGAGAIADLLIGTTK